MVVDYDGYKYKMEKNCGSSTPYYFWVIPLGEAKCLTPEADDDHDDVDDEDDDGDDGIIDNLSVVQLYFWSYHGVLS